MDSTQQSNESEPLLLLPGMMCDARLFTPQINVFSADRPIMTVPIGGHETTEALAAETLRNAPPRFALLGLSMGGIVAMEMMEQAPERITRLALLDTNPLAELDEVKARREPQIEAVRGGGLRAVMRDEMKPNYLTDGPNTGAILDLCMAMAETLGPDVFVRQSRALQTRPDRRDTLRGVDVPTLILCGEDDTLCPVERHQMMAQLVSGAWLEIVERAGHLPVLENPDHTNEAIRQWLAQ